MATDPFFNFGFINALLSTFPPQLAKETEECVKAVGFDGLLTAVMQNKEATRFIHHAVGKAIDEIRRNRLQLPRTREAIMSKIHIGAKVIVQ